MKKFSYWSLLSVSFLIPMMLFVYFNILAPRPFALSEIDAENGTYWIAQLLYNGQPQFVVSHPGTPTYHLAAAILALSGPGLSALPRFFLTLHFVVALITALSLCVFIRVCLRKIPLGVSALAVASIVAWPSNVTLLDYSDTSSYHVPFGVLMLSSFWSNLDRARHPGKIKLLLTGLLLGLCLATKLSFLTVVPAILVASSIHILLNTRPISKAWGSLLILPASTILAFLLLIAPSIGRLPNLILGLGASGSPRWVGGRPLLLEAFDLMLRNTLPLALLLAAGSGVFVYLFVGRLRKLRTNIIASPAFAEKADSSQFLPAGVFISLMLLAFIYAMAGVVPDGEPGVQLRNAAPTVLVAPFLILFCYRLLIERRSLPSPLNVKVQFLLVVLSVAVIAYPILHRIDRRRNFMAARSQSIAQTLSRLEELRRPNTRIAFWDDSANGLLGEVDLHFTGNYEYAGEFFDQLLLREYPNYTLFRINDAPRIINERADGKEPSHTPGARFGRLGIFWRRLFPTEMQRRNDDIVAGENRGVRVSIFACPRQEFEGRLQGTSEGELLNLINERFGPPKIWTESIAGVDWVVISVPGLASPNS